MGSGKTTIGKMLSRQLGLKFADTDQVIEESSGADVGWIFDVEGEAGFRKRETQVLDELTRQNNVVIATGGGVVLDSENRNNLSARGTVIYLNTPVEQQVERTAKGGDRPLLRDRDPMEVLTELHEQRDGLYRTTADIVIDAKNKNSKDLVRDIVEALGLE